MGDVIRMSIPFTFLAQSRFSFKKGLVTYLDYCLTILCKGGFTVFDLLFVKLYALNTMYMHMYTHTYISSPSIGRYMYI